MYRRGELLVEGKVKVHEARGAGVGRGAQGLVGARPGARVQVGIPCRCGEQERKGGT